MVKSVSLEDAHANLKAWIESIAQGGQIVITENSRPIARLVGENVSRGPRPQPGAGKGEILYMASDFDAPLEEFKEYA